jgi:hypothetical protein
MSIKIRIVHVLPPIPIRDFDWCAFYDGDDETPHLHGYGATKDEALADLKRIMWEAEMDDERNVDTDEQFGDLERPGAIDHEMRF